MDERQLHTFLVMYKELNFTKTAEILSFAQSTVSGQINQLEHELGIRLFERLGKKVIPTHEGHRFYEYANRITQIYSEAREEFRKDSSQLRIAAAESLIITRLTQVIMKFKEHYPDTELFLIPVECNEYESCLIDGRADILFAIGTSINNPSLYVPIQHKEEISVYSAPDSSINDRKLQAADFNGYPMILTGKGCHYREQFLSSLGETAPLIVMETGNIQAVKQAAVCKIGACVLPDTAVIDEVTTGRLKRVNYEFESKIFSQCVYHKDKWITEQMRYILELLE